MRSATSPLRQLLREGKYLAALAEIEKALVDAPEERRSSLLQSKAMFLAFCGEERLALEALAEAPRSGLSTPKPLTDVILQDARKEVLKQAAKRQVVVLNEAHHIPRHRAFGRSLLLDLRRLGFTHFAAETFAPPREVAQSLARRVVTRQTGYYTQEPVFAAYVQTALELGFQLVSYEIEEDRREGTPEEQINTREEAQASNLYERVFARNPQARLFVHVGYSHATRTPVSFTTDGKETAITWMAGRLEKKLGRSVLTVDQTGGTEAGEGARESMVLRSVLARRDLVMPAVVQKTDGSFLKEGIGTDCDIAVFHPRARARDGRPDWLFSLAGRRGARLPSALEPRAGRVLVQAFAENAPPDAVASDQCLLTPNAPRPVLVLPKGRYRLVVQDESGNATEAGRLVV